MNNNKWKSNRGLKAVLAVVSVLMAAVMAGSIAAVAVIGELGAYGQSKEEVLEEEFDRCSEIYSVMAIANRDNDTMKEELAATNFRYGVIKAEDLNTVDISDPASYEYYNFETMPGRNAVGEDEARAVRFQEGPYTRYGWDCSLFGYSYVYDENEDFASAETTKQVPITGYYYNVADGIFYYETEEEYYRVDEVGLPVGVNDCMVDFKYDSGQKSYYNLNRDVSIVSDYYLTFDRFDDMGSSWETWDSINLDERSFTHTEIRFADDESTDTGMFNGKPIADHFYFLDDGDGVLAVRADEDEAEADSNKVETYWVVSQVREPLQKTENRQFLLDGDLFEQAVTVMDLAYTWRYGAIVILVVSLILWAVSTILVLIMAGHRGSYEIVEIQPGEGGIQERMASRTESEGAEQEEAALFGKEAAVETERRWVDAVTPGFWQKIPLDVETFIMLVVASLPVAVGASLYYSDDLWKIAMVVFCAAVWYIVCYVWLIDFVVRVKCGKWWRGMLCYKCLAWIWRQLKKVWRKFMGACRFLQENISLIWKALLILGGLCLLEFIGILVTGYSPEAELLIWFVYRGVTLVLILFGVVQAHKLKEGAKKLAEGNLQEKVQTEKMFWEFKKHGETLNCVGDGISLAVEKRMQSEHFRTELITNVSHDIKTPLTSIINYVDLLQKEEIHNEKAAEYLEVLSRQSARLKKLTEDLVEASKASTGSMPVQMERLELGVFLTQTVGEFEEKIAAAGLHVVMHKPETEVFVNADGRHLWRVVENLVQNICKYAQSGTRVYIDLDDGEKEAVISFKNISHYELNISGDALMERFVRGDASRHTEGSGLGLSIAGSLMELMRGKLEIVVDGDLFKVVLHFPK